MAIEAAVQANAELMVCLAVTLPVANANAAARRTMGNPVVREEILEILGRARAAGATRGINGRRRLVQQLPLGQTAARTGRRFAEGSRRATAGSRPRLQQQLGHGRARDCVLLNDE